MGLDITAYSKLEYIETMEDAEAWEGKYYWPENPLFRTAHARHWEPAYADRAAPIIDGGVYRIDGEEFGFRAGAYSGYNRWREHLSLMALGVMPHTVWNDEARYSGKPFFELIDFSDCEGIIGSQVAAKLATDFAAYQEQADRHPDEWFREKYAAWRKAFELAADNGMVEFH